MNVSDIPSIFKMIFWTDLRIIYWKMKPTALKGDYVKSKHLTEWTKWTYAQGTKLIAVAGGIKPVPLKMTGLKSSVSI